MEETKTAATAIEPQGQANSPEAANPPPSPAAIPNLAPKASAFTSMPVSMPKKEHAKEFRSYLCDSKTLSNIETIRARFTDLLETITAAMPPETQNARYLAIVKTKLEEACMMTIKGLSSH